MRHIETGYGILIWTKWIEEYTGKSRFFLPFFLNSHSSIENRGVEDLLSAVRVVHGWMFVCTCTYCNCNAH
jgi:hypothetical protein